MELIDSHCHLQFEKLAANLDQVLKDARAAGVKRMVCVGTSLADSARAIEIASANEGVWASAGAHPHDGNDFLDHADGAQLLAELLKKPKVVAVGEIGLDYFHPHTPPDKQIAALRAQIEASLSSGLPFIFHVRDAFSDFWQIVDDYKIERAVVHSFTAGTKTLNKIIERGWYVGLNGIMTFTRDQAQLEAAKAVPKERLILETDAPFLTPAPNRSELCEPKHVRVTAEFLANLRGETLEQLAAATTANAENLFGLKP